MTSRATAGAEARDALSRALLTLAEDGQRPRCSDAPHLALSDDIAERAIATTWCEGCPVFAECEAAGQFEKFGVWAGVDRGPDPASKKERRARRVVRVR